MLSAVRRLLAPWEDKIGKPTFFGESREERLASLETDDPEVARELLEEARRLNESVQTMADGVERRATTLQGVVSIAATLAVAGGALLLDPSKVQGVAWRVALGLLFAGLLYCFVATAYRATQSSTEVQRWAYEDPRDHLTRTQRPAVEVDIELSADLLHAYGMNTEVVRWKVTYLRAASEWFLRGLIFLGLIAATISVYVVAHDPRPDPATEARPPIEINVLVGARADAGGDRPFPGPNRHGSDGDGSN